MPRRKRLTDAGIARLRPQECEYTVWDMSVAGLGVRVRPSGSRTFIYRCKTLRGVKKMSLGPAGLRKVEEVRRDCLAAAAEAVEAEENPRAPAPLFRDFVTGPWKTVRLSRCKPATQTMYGGLLKRELLPAFGSRRLDRITRSMALGWFERCSRTTPANANRALTLLGQIFNHAVSCGHIEANPVRGTSRNREARRTRFLSRQEIVRLHLALGRYARGSASQAQQADIIRLLLLTGCRRNEIRRLRREEVKNDRLELSDSKTGPRTVLLNAQAREIVKRRMAEGNSPWVFPSPHDAARPRSPDLALWYRVRLEAGIEDLRLHDLRHTVASQAAMNGIPLPVVARLLGHSDVRMTMRYAHVGDRETEAAAERVGRAVGAMMNLRGPSRSGSRETGRAHSSVDNER